MSAPKDQFLTLPGLIDCHVHFREPGLEHKATMKSEAAAARAGGVTTVCEMPNTIPPTVTVAALADKVRRANEITDCDLRFYFGATEPAHLLALRELWTGESGELKRLKARCSGLKLYLDHSTGNQKASSEVVESAFALCAEWKIPLIGHCEDPDMNAAALKANTRTDLAAHSVIRSAESEAKSIRSVLDLIRKHGTPFHVAHLSTKQGIDLVRQAKKELLPITCEVAPHHLFLTVEDYETLGTLAKMNPPLRTKDHQEALWAAIADGTVDCISTDHAPHTLEEKQAGEPLKAPSGVPGVETMLPLLLTVMSGSWPSATGLQATNYKLEAQDIVRLCFTNPNRIFRLGKKGLDEPGGDRVTVDPNAEWTIDAKKLHSKCKWTPYHGWSVKGKIVQLARRP